MPTFGTWERTVLEHAYDEVDYVSLHAYYEEHDGDRRRFLGLRRRAWTGSSTPWSRPPTRSPPASTADKRIRLSFDEWNVWYQSRLRRRGTPTSRSRGPALIEDVYT